MPEPLLLAPPARSAVGVGFKKPLATISPRASFADLSGFTALSGKIGPEELMEVTNTYLAM